MAPPPGTGRGSGSPDAVTVQLIETWGLMPHPEGGWYREMHRSREPVTRADGQQRAALTTILFLLDRQSVSRWHRVRHADEVWIHLQGAPLTLWELPPEGGSPSHRILSLQHPIQVIPADHWQAAKPEGPYSLVSCCVGPGFDFSDFCMLRDLAEDQHPAGILKELI